MREAITILKREWLRSYPTLRIYDLSHVFGYACTNSISSKLYDDGKNRPVLELMRYMLSVPEEKKRDVSLIVKNVEFWRSCKWEREIGLASRVAVLKWAMERSELYAIDEEILLRAVGQ